MYELVKNVKFKQNVTNTLQNTLKQNIREMNRDDRMYVAADKTSNYYKVTKEKYMEMMKQNVTKEYKKSSDKVIEKVNNADKEVAEVEPADKELVLHLYPAPKSWKA